ncbi:hypothetical protein BpHYR1_024506 [Brachionus plicatilis]|uniref:Uncharacterized protein n=1 Tax=Brachionus plicatilis TaxID=10195 RepID=A0A3M7PXV4_BRAPC|nr:hypothetical protein BpHYR1_024506 [Brachionus plicatilis]
MNKSLRKNCSGNFPNLMLNADFHHVLVGILYDYDDEPRRLSMNKRRNLTKAGAKHKELLQLFVLKRLQNYNISKNNLAVFLFSRVKLIRRISRTASCFKSVDIGKHFDRSQIIFNKKQKN